VIDPHPPFARENGEESDQRQGEQHPCRGASARKGDGEPDRSEPGVDHVDGAHRAQMEPRRHAERRPLTNHRAAVVEGKLGAKRDGIDRPAPKIRLRFARQPENESRPDRIPGVDEPQKDALDVQLATRVLERIAEQDADGDPQRDHAGGKDEQHRNEDELRRDGRAVTSLLTTKAISLRFTATSGATRIDDVYLDPFKDT
jgi:hypothetical protein